MLNSLDPDQDHHSVIANQGLNCLEDNQQMTNVTASKEIVKNKLCLWTPRVCHPFINPYELSIFLMGHNPGRDDSDQGLHCLLTACSIKMKNTIQQPIQ